MSNKLIEAAAMYITKTVIKEGAYSTTAEDSSVTKKVVKHTQDEGADHVMSHHGQHAYIGQMDSSDTTTYHVHDSKSGKTHSVEVDHSEGKASKNSFHKAFEGTHAHPDLVKKLHKWHNSQLSHGSDE